MSDPQDASLRKRHSFYERYHREFVQPGTYCNSDANLILPNESVSRGQLTDLYKDGEVTSSEKSGCGEYYKRSEHDAMPVKDDSVSCNVTSTESGNGEGISLTESHLVKLEKHIFSNISQELPTSTSSSALDSNAKFFKTTVDEIFDKFHANMIDFERYKKRYHAILNRDQEDNVEQMEDFVKDMIHHIMSSESSDFNESRLCTVTDKGTSIGANENPTHCSLLRNWHSVVEAFKNDNYLTGSTVDDKGRRKSGKRKNRNEEILSICRMSGSPCVEIKMNNRKLLSEMKFNESRVDRHQSLQAASAEDIKKVAAKKLALELFERQQNETYTPRHFYHRDIPVKQSFAKKNIHLDQDFDHDSGQNDKSFISRICNYLCKRLRRTSIV